MKNYKVSHFSLKSLNPIIQALNKEIKIAAVLCYGSYAEGTQDEKSDIDLLVICDEPIPAANIRNEIYEKNHCEQIKQGLMGGYHYDLLYKIF